MEAVPVSYAGFWKRFAAYLIDTILISTVQFWVLAPMLALLGLHLLSDGFWEDFTPSLGFLVTLIGAYLGVALFTFIVHWLYYALMESSARGATIGKMVLGIRVVDTAGNRVSFARATGRHFGKFVSSLILGIGYLMAGFTDRKQALHDILANCIVINQRL